MAISLDLAIAAIRAGRKEEGRQLLNLLIQQNPNDEKAWLWMSSVVDTDEQRARCLYHVLAINPTSDLARRGLQVLGIVVSDSRPVKIPRDSQPIKIPNPTPAPSKPVQPQISAPQFAQEERRPFLVDPGAITQELPFVPVKPPFAQPEKIQASPAILAIDVESVPDTPLTPAVVEAVPAPKYPRESGSHLVKTQKMPSPFEDETPLSQLNLPATNQPMVNAVAGPNGSTGQDAIAAALMATAMESAQEHPDMTPAANNAASAGQANGVGQPAATNNNQYYPPTPQPPANGLTVPPNETRPSQPVPVTYPNMGIMPNGQPGYYLPQPVNPVMGMPQPMPSIHSTPTMGMPMPSPFEYRPPSEPVPVISGMLPYGQYQPQNYAFHSSATMMMPTMTEAEARARLATQAMPTASAMAMPLQNSNWPAYGLDPQFSETGYNAGYDEDEEEGSEINILAVIIFGTLSVTALGGLGMLILLIFTTPTPV